MEGVSAVAPVVPTPHEISGCVNTHPLGVGPFVGDLVGVARRCRWRCGWRFRSPGDSSGDSIGDSIGDFVGFCVGFCVAAFVSPMKRICCWRQLKPSLEEVVAGLLRLTLINVGGVAMVHCTAVDGGVTILFQQVFAMATGN